MSLFLTMLISFPLAITPLAAFHLFFDIHATEKTLRWQKFFTCNPSNKRCDLFNRRCFFRYRFTQIIKL